MLRTSSLNIGKKLPYTLYVGGHPYRNFNYVPPELLSNPEKYKFNKHGYRCPELEKENKDFRVVTVGCSHSFGWGLEVEERYSTILCKLLSTKLGIPVKDWNLSLPSKSNDYISHALLQTIPQLEPDLVLVVFTGIYRREFFDIDGKCLDFLLGRPNNDKLICREMRSAWLENNKLIYNSLKNLASTYDSNMNLFKNYCLIRYLLGSEQIPWLYAFVDEKQILTEVLANLSKDNYVGEWVSLDQISKEDHHRGRKSHLTLAQKFFDNYHKG